MPQDETLTTSPIEKLHLTPEQEAVRQQAENWLKDAGAAYQAELTELQAASPVPVLGRTATHAVAPHISSAPDHIKRGTQIDQEIWKAENAEEDDYQARLDEDHYGPSAKDLADEQAQDERKHREGEIYDTINGGTENFDYGLNGDIGIVKEGYDSYSNGPVDSLTLMDSATKFADLQSQRDKAIKQDQPDPLRGQMAAMYENS